MRLLGVGQALQAWRRLGAAAAAQDVRREPRLYDGPAYGIACQAAVIQEAIQIPAELRLVRRMI